MVYSNTLQKIKLFSILMILFFVFPIFTAEANVNTEQFSCYTYDAQNHIIDGYWDDEDETWYLFLTSSQSVTESMLYFTGNAVDVSNGTLDSEASTVKEAFRKNGDEITLTLEDGSVHHIVALQSTLPSVYIDLNDTTLEKIHEDKDKKHKNNSIYITDPDGVYDLSVEDSVEIKGRGNSTWREYEKKAYQIKFDKKTSVMNMNAAKKWVLLANASDDSMIRTKLVYDMAENMDMGFVCDMKYVDLWIEGDYRGTFLLGEKIEPGSSRLDLKNNAGAIFEQEEGFYYIEEELRWCYMDEDNWLYNKSLDRHFVLKEIVEEDDVIIADAMGDFNKTIDDLMRYLYYTPSEMVSLEMLSTMIDVDSFAKYYLVNEYVLNKESFATSFYWYKDGADDVIHLGPLWDFDTCMGNDNSAYDESYGHNHTLFYYLLAAPEFYERTQQLFEEYINVLDNMSAHVDILVAEIVDSAEMNYIRWNVLGTPNPKSDTEFYPTFDEATDALKYWLVNRMGTFTVAHPVVEFENTIISMYRLYNPNSGEHFYTGSITERDTLIQVGWNYEGIAWSSPFTEGLPVYRLYNPVAGDHHYTGSMEEVENLLHVGWQYEGVAWNTPVTGIGVYRLYNPNAYTGCHHYTPSEEERDHLVDLGWHYEGIAWNGAVV